MKYASHVETLRHMPQLCVTVETLHHCGKKKFLTQCIATYYYCGSWHNRNISADIPGLHTTIHIINNKMNTLNHSYFQCLQQDKNMLHSYTKKKNGLYFRRNSDCCPLKRFCCNFCFSIRLFDCKLRLNLDVWLREIYIREIGIREIRIRENVFREILIQKIVGWFVRFSKLGFRKWY